MQPRGQAFLSSDPAPLGANKRNETIAALLSPTIVDQLPLLLTTPIPPSSPSNPIRRMRLPNPNQVKRNEQLILVRDLTESLRSPTPCFWPRRVAVQHAHSHLISVALSLATNKNTDHLKRSEIQPHLIFKLHPEGHSLRCVCVCKYLKTRTCVNNKENEDTLPNEDVLVFLLCPGDRK